MKKVTSPQTPPLAVTIKEAARLLSVNHQTVRRLIAAGKLRSFRANTAILIPMTELNLFMQGNTHGPENLASN